MTAKVIESFIDTNILVYSVDLSRPNLQLSNVTVLSISEQVREHWLNLLGMNPVKGAKVFDIFHLATMLTYNIHRVYTFNDTDFNWYSDVEVIVPGFS